MIFQKYIITTYLSLCKDGIKGVLFCFPSVILIGSVQQIPYTSIFKFCKLEVIQIEIDRY